MEYGAAEQAQSSQGEVSSQAQDLLLFDATPLPMSWRLLELDDRTHRAQLEDGDRGKIKTAVQEILNYWMRIIGRAEHGLLVLGVASTLRETLHGLFIIP